MTAKKDGVSYTGALPIQIEVIEEEADPYAEAAALLRSVACQVPRGTANTAPKVADWLRDTWPAGIVGLGGRLPQGAELTDLQILTAPDGFKAASRRTDGHLIFTVAAPNPDGEDPETVPICEGLTCTILSEASGSYAALAEEKTYWFDLSDVDIPGRRAASR